MSLRLALHEWRTALWHLRRGGTSQLRRWRARQRAASSGTGVRRSKGAEGRWHGWPHRRLTFAPFDVGPISPRRPDLRVAVILDDFSLRAFAHEWSLLVLDEGMWKEQLEAEDVDLLFIESAWRPNHGRWRSPLNGMITDSHEIRQLIDTCRSSGIPSVFWAKEDPVHYDDFIACARLVDSVLTTDENRLSAYRRDLGHDRVDILPFAAQPALHHPARPRRAHHSRGVAFAGMYFSHKFPHRRDQLDYLLGGAADLVSRGGTTLEILARNEDQDERYRFPERFRRFVVGSLDYDRMLTAYRAYRVFLNVNTVADSPTMCARRLFEIPASGTSIITAPTPATERFFAGTGMVQVSTREETTRAIESVMGDTDTAERTLHRVQRRIWDEHTYAHRAESVLRFAVPSTHVPVAMPSVSALVSTFRPERLESVLCTLGRQQDVNLQVVLLTHGYEPRKGVVRQLQHDSGIRDLVVLTAPSTLSLGACLNRCAGAADGDVFAKIDDDDVYAEMYLHDAVNALRYSGADVVGKQAHYMQVGGRVLLRFPDAEHRWTDRVMGPTIVARRDVCAAVPFEDVARAEDTRFLGMITAAGGRVYSADRFNFCQTRGGSGHTWTVSDDVLETSSRYISNDDPRRIITL